MMYVIWIIFLICFAKFNDQRLFYHMLAWLRGMVHGCSRFNAPFILYETNFLGIITYQWLPILKTLPSCSPVKAPNPNPRNKTPHQKRIKKERKKERSVWQQADEDTYHCTWTRAMILAKFIAETDKFRPWNADMFIRSSRFNQMNLVLLVIQVHPWSITTVTGRVCA